MAAFREILAALGYTDVRTLLNSGNAVFAGDGRAPAEHASAISNAIEQRLGLRVPVIVKSRREFSAVEAGNSLGATADNHSRMFVAFTSDARDLKSLGALAALTKPPERFVMGRHAAYLWCPHGILQSDAGKALLGRAGRVATTRNWATVLKLGALLREDPA